MLVGELPKPAELRDTLPQRPGAMRLLSAAQCRIVLEFSPAFTAQTQTAAVTPGQSVTFTLTPTNGYMRITLNQLRNERLAKGQFSMRQMICC